MKKIFSIIAILALGLSMHAQDGRQRTVETIVADVLAQIPCKTAALWADNMNDIATNAPASVEKLADMLVPSAKGGNNLVEYAIAGVTAYVSDIDHAQYRNAVKEGLQAAAAKIEDPFNVQFLLSQLRMLSELEPAPEVRRISIAEARGQMKASQSHLRIEAADVIIAEGSEKDAEKILGACSKSCDRAYRNAVIGFATERLGAGKVADILYKKLNAKSLADYKCDVLNWTGANNFTGKAADVAAFIADADPSVARTAISAAGRIVCPESLQALLAALDGPHAAEAKAALLRYQGSSAEQVVEALQNVPEKSAAPLMAIASERHMKGAADKVFELAASEDAAVRDAAIAAIKGVSGLNDAERIAYMLDNVQDEKSISALSEALMASVWEIEGAEERFGKVRALSARTPVPERYYEIMAATGADSAFDFLQAAGATQALKHIDNPKALPLMSSLAKEGDVEAARAYLALARKHVAKADERRMYYADILPHLKDKDTRDAALALVGELPTMRSFILAGQYLDDAQSSYAAAGAVKRIAATTEEEIDYSLFKANLEKAKAIFAAAGGADDGYAVDEISKMLVEAEPSPISVLSAEEAAAGFEMLFDGTDLSKWQGDLEGYVPVNGAIYVSANYGTGGNLYTKKEYRDFVLRFEFCFLQEGVNNGVGVRTPMGVDAAYWGMCEVQVLDHDAPMYKDLRHYQVHGSVYGVIPAKRIVHKPLGQWSTEEIVVKGDHIKVTVNGEVIVDGDIRKACKGHNVAPDGGKVNPYTVDHLNHPGMFNERGFISFCGHGEGLKYRNIRIKEL